MQTGSDYNLNGYIDSTYTINVNYANLCHKRSDNYLRGQFQVFEDNDDEGIGHVLSTLPNTSYYWIYLEQKPYIDSIVAQQKPNIRHKIQNALTRLTYQMQRDSLSKKERRKYTQLIDRQMDSIATDYHLGEYGRSKLGHYAPRRLFALDLSFFMAMPTIDESFNNIRFYGGDIAVKATTSKGDFGLGFSIGFGKNEGDDIHYEDIYHKGGETAGGVAPYIRSATAIQFSTIRTTGLSLRSNYATTAVVPEMNQSRQKTIHTSSFSIPWDFITNTPLTPPSTKRTIVKGSCTTLFTRQSISALM